MVDQQYTVTLILDPDFGDETSLPSFPHVWIMDTPANRMLVSTYWHQNAESQTGTSMTTFKFSADEEAEQICLRLLDTIDLHHGEYSSNPPYSALEVIGLRLSSKVKEALEQLGFEEFIETDSGFRAEGRSTMAESQDN